MVVHLDDAAPAHAAVVRAQGLECAAALAELAEPFALRGGGEGLVSLGGGRVGMGQ